MVKREGGAVKWVRKNAELRVEGVQVRAILQKHCFVKMRKMNFFHLVVTNDTERDSNSETDDHVFPPEFAHSTALSLYLSLQT